MLLIAITAIDCSDIHPSANLSKYFSWYS